MLAAVLAAGLLVALVALFCAPSAGAASLYWTNDAGDPGHPGTVGRASIDGTAADNAFITSPNGACGVAANAGYVYWSVGGGAQGYVARASLATKAIENTFLTTVNNLNCGVAVNASSIFFNNYVIGAIARANIDGSGADQTFVTGGSNPQMPAVSASHVYWVNKNGQAVGRADLNGDDVDQALIATKCPEPVGVAVDATYVYWANTNCESIGRAKLDGTEVDQDFVELDEEGACGLAVDAGHIYWGRYGDETSSYVGRASIGGGDVDEKFIAASGYTCGVAVGPDPVAPAPPAGPPLGPPVPSPTFALVPPIRCTADCKKILVKFRFDAAGKVVAAQAKPKKGAKKPKLIRRLAKPVGAGLVTLRLKPTKAGKEVLAAKGKLRSKLSFTFTPTTGTATTITRGITAKPPKK